MAQTARVRSIPVRSRLNITGVWSVEPMSCAEQRPFVCYFAPRQTVVVIELPSWWNATRVLMLLGALAIVITVSSMW